MSLRSENLPYAFYKGRVTNFKNSNRFLSTYYGGPSEVLVNGEEHGPRPLHHIFTVRNIDLGVVGYDFGFIIPFFYGMTFDGCRLEYKRRSTQAIEVTKISPSISSEDWPYPGYPLHLPYIPLEVNSNRECSLQEFSDSVMQGVLRTSETELIVVVPTNPESRMSIWGPSGDAESVQIIFRYDTATGITMAYNACS
jgi:hypothetical protein